ncbi:MAG: hypothetical protein JWM87_2958 [Candidatus Eremiobacteraeota bacterium]|nr:hypothetical protein [Candidatus Eremiobacteraeota bacterium]
MATVRIEGETLNVELRGWDKVWAVHGSFAIPLANIAGASTDKPPSFWETLKVIGTATPTWPLSGEGEWPHLKMAGTFLYHGEVVFFDYQGKDNVLVIDLRPGASAYKHLFVHVDEPDTPEEAALRINAALASIGKPEVNPA